MQQVVNALATEAERPAISMLQLALPIEIGRNSTLTPVLPDY
jgi:hypothetical protein